MQASVHEIKSHLSAYLHKVQAGCEVLITSHKKPVARLTPLAASAPLPAKTRAQWLNELDVFRTGLPTTPHSSVLQLRDEERY